MDRSAGMEKPGIEPIVDLYERTPRVQRPLLWPWDGNQHEVVPIAAKRYEHDDFV